MELNLIEYLLDKNFDNDQIMRFQKAFLDIDDKDVIKRLNALYKIFGYADLSQLEINELISNNFMLLKKSDLELIKIAFCWAETGLLSEAAVRKMGIRHNEPDRIYLRNLYLNSGINYNKSPISYNSLVMGDAGFQKDYRGSINNFTNFYPTYENLILLFGKGKTFEEKKEYISEMIDAKSVNWILGCIRKEKENKKNKNKENNGYGSI